MTNKIKFHKTENNKYKLELTYEDSRTNLIELYPVNEIENIVNIMSDDRGHELYKGINKIEFSKGFMTEEIDLLKNISKEYIKASNQIYKLKEIVNERDLRDHIRNEKSTNTQTSEYQYEDITDKLPENILLAFLEQMRTYIGKITELENNINSVNMANYLQKKK